ncbi:hypothetical protein VTN00DRAFT_6252 [Thermoascus crustaceus]|uniref:uncharacterized protein n=1 Tax=Thermoascus crustaceus TaxID=5088 RepID=UPI0037442E6C
MQDLFDRRTPAVTEAVHEFIRGYVRWHICDNKRYRMKELYDACGCVDIKDHLLATAVQDQVKPSSTSNEKSNHGSRQIARTDSNGQRYKWCL